MVEIILVWEVTILGLNLLLFKSKGGEPGRVADIVGTG